VTTTLHEEKTTRQRRARLAQGDWVEGYEIHHGRTTAGAGVRESIEGGLGWSQGCLTGVYLHGLFENTDYRARFLSALGWRGKTSDWRTRIDSELERLAALMGPTGWDLKPR
jgi:adenosylcobyric acid synthase